MAHFKITEKFFSARSIFIEAESFVEAQKIYEERQHDQDWYNEWYEEFDEYDQTLIGLVDEEASGGEALEEMGCFTPVHDYCMESIGEGESEFHEREALCCDEHFGLPRE